MNRKITIVIPYHNERESVEFTLEQVGAQTLPAETAILVNSSSTDHTFDVINNWISKNQHRFQTKFLNVFENTDNPASSKNVGIRLARTEWIAFMDCGQNFDADWLAKQARFLENNNVNLVSGVVYLVGENWVDRCAVAQTYGYKIYRPCLPTTLLKRDIFSKTGLFLEGRRSGYDVAWLIKLKKMGISRGINENVVIHYIGINFASNLTQLFKKSILYAKPSSSIEGYWTPYLYVVAFIVSLGALAYSTKVGVVLFLAYLATRTLLIPILKSKNAKLFREHPFQALLGLGIVGMVLDLGKLIGTLQGIFHYHIAAVSPAKVQAPDGLPAIKIDSEVAAESSNQWQLPGQDKREPVEQQKRN